MYQVTYEFHGSTNVANYEDKEDALRFFWSILGLKDVASAEYRRIGLYG